MLVIGITGTLGAGKGTIVEYLQSKYSFEHYSVRKYLTDILVKQGKEPNRDNFTILANSLRTAHNSPSYLIEQLYIQAKQSDKPCIIESIRTTGEIEKLKQLGPFVLLAVDAPAEVRYQRIIGRKSETDAISFETFRNDEAREYFTSDPHKQNLSACIALADYVLSNDGNLTKLHHQVDEIMEKVL